MAKKGKKSNGKLTRDAVINVFINQFFYLKNGRNDGGISVYKDRVSMRDIWNTMQRKPKNPWGYIFTNVQMSNGNGNHSLPWFVYVNKERKEMVIYDFNPDTAERRIQTTKNLSNSFEDWNIHYVVVEEQYSVYINGMKTTVFKLDRRDKKVSQPKDYRISNCSNKFSNLSAEYDQITHAVCIDTGDGRVIAPLQGRWQYTERQRV